MIEPKFRNINTLFVLNGDNDPRRYSFVKYYMQLVEIKNKKCMKNLLKCQEMMLIQRLYYIICIINIIINSLALIHQDK